MPHDKLIPEVTEGRTRTHADMARDASVRHRLPMPTSDEDHFKSAASLVQAWSLVFTWDRERIYDYVDKRARAANTRIKKNRGVPPNATPESMLSLHEKAVVLLARALSIPWDQTEVKIIEGRQANKETVMPGNFETQAQRVVENHLPVVRALQVELVQSIEKVSPLVGGPARLLWRAQVLEYYRKRMIEIAEDDWIPPHKKDGLLMTLDRAMQKHFKFFDSVMSSEELRRLLENPSDRFRSLAIHERELEIQAAFDAGDITDSERIDQIRELRFGAESDGP